MIQQYVYDVEIFPNFLGITFIPENTPQQIIDGYIKVDTFIRNHNDDKDKEKVEEYKAIKSKLLTAMNIKQFNIYNTKDGSRNDLDLLMNFFQSHKILTGYNSINYDAIMLDIIINEYKFVDAEGYHTKNNNPFTLFMFDHSAQCIQYGKGYNRLLKFTRYYKRPFTDFDIQKILYLDKTFTGLKQVAICLKWYRIQDLPLPYDKNISFKDVDKINDYNVNDVLITLALKRNQRSEIDLREQLSNKFDINCRNLSRSSIGKAITTKLYSLFSGIEPKEFMNKITDRKVVRLEEVLSSNIKFKTKELNDVLNLVKQQVIHVGNTKFSHEFYFRGTIYNMGLGGLHSKDDPHIFTNDDCIIRDADVASFYPNGIIQFGVCPAHLDKTSFVKTVDYTTKTRVAAKHKGKKLEKEGKYDEAEVYNTEAAGLKIAINRMYGAFRDKFDYLYDPLCTYTVTVNLQLTLLMLIEDLEEHGIHVISANTDGIVCKFTQEQEATYYDCCNKWQERTKFELEFTDYEKYLRNDVNNYIAIKKGFAEHLAQGDKANAEKHFVKRKGLFIQEIEFNKGYNAPVISIALNKYLLYGIPYIETIENHIKSSPTAIYDYCISQKSNAKFDIIYRHIEEGKVVDEVLQKSNRFYICNVGSSSGTLIKKEKGKTTKENRIVAKFAVQPFNDYVYKEDYSIDMYYYKTECSKILYGVSAKRKIKKQGMIATMETLF